MKKTLAFAVASVMTISSMSTLASATQLYSFADGNYDKENLTKYGVPSYDVVAVDLDIATSWSDNGYESHTSSSPLQQKASRATFYAKADLDMTKIAAEWEAYLNAAEEYAKTTLGIEPEVAREFAMEQASISGEYTISITVPGTGKYDDRTLKGIENTKLAAQDESAWKWETKNVGDYSYSALSFFDYKNPATSYEEKDGMRNFTINMQMKDDLSARTLDEYFTHVNGENGDEYKNLTLLVPENNVGGTGTTYEIKGEFSGYVKLEIGAGMFETRVDLGEKTGGELNDDGTRTESGVKPITDSDFVRLRTSGGGGGGGGSTPASSETPAPTEQVTETPSENPSENPSESPSENPSNRPEQPTVEPQTGGSSTGATLNYDDHYAYIIGYPAEEGQSEDYREVRPQNNITRAEVATIFFRMLTDESRAKFWSTENVYSDVNTGDWFNNAVSTATAAGIVNGYDTGDFKPNNAITRAEFAAIASRFTSVEYNGDGEFNDIAGHWAEEAINRAAVTGWINGYDDGSFKPDQYITRAEAMTLINRILYRLVDGEENLSADMVKWIDNDPSAWYYENVQEATNSHSYDREAIGLYEKWVGITEPRDWEALEKETATAAAAGSEKSVFDDFEPEK